MTCKGCYLASFSNSSGNIDARYERIPITDEQAPRPRQIDSLIECFEQEPQDCLFVFNCQMGRGRTTTGMVMFALWKCFTGHSKLDIKNAYQWSFADTQINKINNTNYLNTDSNIFINSNNSNKNNKDNQEIFTTNISLTVSQNKSRHGSVGDLKTNMKNKLSSNETSDINESEIRQLAHSTSEPVVSSVVPGILHVPSIAENLIENEITHKKEQKQQQNQQIITQNEKENQSVNDNDNEKDKETEKEKEKEKKSGKNDKPKPLEILHASREPTMPMDEKEKRYIDGEYKCVLDLLRMLKRGKDVKRMVIYIFLLCFCVLVCFALLCDV